MISATFSPFSLLLKQHWTLTGQAYEENNTKLPHIMSKVSPKKAIRENIFNERQ